MTAKKTAKPIKRKKTASRKKKATPFDPTKPLKATKREAFCVNIVNGGSIKPSSKGGFTISEISATEAYLASGYKATASTARRGASALMTNRDIKARVDHLRAEQARMLAERGVVDKNECLEVLTAMIRSGAVNEPVDPRFKDIHPKDRIGAIKAAGDFLGFNQSDETEEKKVNVYKEFMDALIDPIPDSERTPQTG